MSLRTKFLSIILAAAAVAAFSTFTLAQNDQAATPAPDKEKAEKAFHHGDHKGEFAGRHEGGFGMRHGGMMRMMHDLNLTDAQKTQMHSIMEANKPDQATMEEFRTLGKAKHEGTLTADQQARFKTLREQSMAKMKSVHEQMLNVLTPEQKAQMEQKKAEMKLHREEFRQKREQWKQQKQTAPAATTEKTQVN